jgi:hypothetical protein
MNKLNTVFFVFVPTIQMECRYRFFLLEYMSNMLRRRPRSDWHSAAMVEDKQEPAHGHGTHILLLIQPARRKPF